eukprot:scaffold754_cov248-Pinguiococcus_pyrenoidosus.AAC.61
MAWLDKQDRDMKLTIDPTCMPSPSISAVLLVKRITLRRKLHFRILRRILRPMESSSPASKQPTKRGKEASKLSTEKNPLWSRSVNRAMGRPRKLAESKPTFRISKRPPVSTAAKELGPPRARVYSRSRAPQSRQHGERGEHHRVPQHHAAHAAQQDRAEPEVRLNCSVKRFFARPQRAFLYALRSGLLNLVPDATDELLQRVDQPLEVATCTETGKAYLMCDYNRDGDSYRCVRKGLLAWAGIGEVCSKSDIGRPSGA